MNNKPQKEVQFGVQDLAPLAIIFVVAIVVIAFGANIVGDIKVDVAKDACADLSGFSYNSTSGACYNASDQVSPGTASYNATTDGLTGLTKFSSKFGLIATIIVAAIIIGIIGRFLFLKMNN